MSDETMTIMINGREALVAHIKDLQDVLTKRNARIAQLEAALTETGQENWVQDREAWAFQKGLEAGRVEMDDRLDDLARDLFKHRREALKIYYEGESNE